MKGLFQAALAAGFCRAATRSRLREVDVSQACGSAPYLQQDRYVKRSDDKKSQGQGENARYAAGEQWQDPQRAEQRNFKGTEAVAKSVCCEKRDRDREHDKIVIENVGRGEQGAGHQQCCLVSFIAGRPPTPHDAGDDRAGDDGLHCIGERDSTTPEPHYGERALQFLESDRTALEQNLARDTGGGEECTP